MVTLASLTCLVAGTVLAGCAHRFATRAALAETAAGVLLILGLVLIGLGLPVFR
ncbi:hypothetical protein [Methylobacterium sp. Leaf118]|uniref:hypothetical protein n=1 Tax=Methylobacterium sp. Leaf118 TaxID=2876562 RepID=UPI001E316EDB|nr:hypothetical protein [Methylobacterium sp. Leaf118]